MKDHMWYWSLHEISQMFFCIFCHFVIGDCECLIIFTRPAQQSTCHTGNMFSSRRMFTISLTNNFNILGQKSCIKFVPQSSGQSWLFSRPLNVKKVYLFFCGHNGRNKFVSYLAMSRYLFRFSIFCDPVRQRHPLNEKFLLLLFTITMNLNHKYISIFVYQHHS